MKVLFSMNLENMDETMGEAYELLAQDCAEARDWLRKNKAAILAHEQEAFVDVAKSSFDPVMQQFVGLRLSYEACCTINGLDDFEYEHNLVDAPSAIAYADVGDEYTVGEFDKQTIVRFADQLHKNANETAIRLLQDADMFGAKLTDKTLMALKGEEAQKVTSAINILQNKPSEALPTAFVIPDENLDDDSEEDVCMRCWPNTEELRDVHENPEYYAIASVSFK